MGDKVNRQKIPHIVAVKVLHILQFPFHIIQVLWRQKIIMLYKYAVQNNLFNNTFADLIYKNTLTFA